MPERRIGVYICYCGGNISDYVDVERVREAIKDEEGVVVAKTTMFACSDAAQQEMIEDIENEKLDGLVVASCSPKLHLLTFRGVAKRAGLNPYQYVQANIREQDSWAHTDDHEGATEKAIRLVRAGIAKTRLTVPLEPFRIDTVPRALVVGAGIAGLRAAIALADLGIQVFLIEREAEAGGWVRRFKRMYPHDRSGAELIAQLLEEVRRREEITLFTEAELIEKSGSVGNFDVKIRAKGEEIPLNVGAIIVATGFTPYTPGEGEYGYGMEGVATLRDFKELVESADGKLLYKGREIKEIAYIYCVGSRQRPDVENANLYCSRYCCNAAVHTSILASEVDPSVHQFHLYRDIRTYGKYELLYEEACKRGAIFIRFSEDEPPLIERSNGRLEVKVKDLLTGGEELELETDLVVLVTGMVPREEQGLVDVLKLPLGRDRFFNEIHPKLRPVETVIDGVFIAGTAQGPKNSAESVASALAAVSKAAGLLMKGYVELEPLIATVNTDACRWCGKCAEACPYSAIERAQVDGKEVAEVNRALCKGCGGCAPVCPADAINIEGYTDPQIKAMIEALLVEATDA